MNVKQNARNEKLQNHLNVFWMVEVFIPTSHFYHFVCFLHVFTSESVLQQGILTLSKPGSLW
jgi:hypothetical protein